MAKVTASDINKARVVVEIGRRGIHAHPVAGGDSVSVRQVWRVWAAQPWPRRFNVRAMGDIVIAGLGLGGKEANDMMMKIIAAPEKLEIIRKLSIFVGILANGGKAPKDDTAEEEGSSGPL
jgi:hypothetical protein